MFAEVNLAVFENAVLAFYAQLMPYGEILLGLTQEELLDLRGSSNWGSCARLAIESVMKEARERWSSHEIEIVSLVSDSRKSTRKRQSGTS